MAKVVVITGAGAGFGRATATEFARDGWDVALLGHQGAHGRFDDPSARPVSWLMLTDRHKHAVLAAGTVALLGGAVGLTRRLWR